MAAGIGLDKDPQGNTLRTHADPEPVRVTGVAHTATNQVGEFKVTNVCRGMNRQERRAGRYDTTQVSPVPFFLRNLRNRK